MRRPGWDSRPPRGRGRASQRSEDAELEVEDAELEVEDAELEVKVDRMRGYPIS
jgi:hypothetical protein